MNSMLSVFTTQTLKTISMPVNGEIHEMVSQDDAATWLGISKRTLFRKVKAGALPTLYRTASNRVAFKRSDLETYVRNLEYCRRDASSDTFTK